MADQHDEYRGAANPPAPAGWYPVDGGLQRYWDGAAWTEHTAPLAAPSGPSPEAPPPEAPAPWVDGAPAGQATSGPQQAMPQQPFVEQPPAAYQGGTPPHGQPAGWAPAAGAMVSADDRSLALITHLLALVSGFIGPLIIWLVKRDESAFLDYHGKEALNFQITMFIYWVVTLIATLVLIGLLIIPVLMILQFVLPIVAGIAANRGEHYRYPLTLRVIP